MMSSIHRFLGLVKWAGWRDWLPPSPWLPWTALAMILSVASVNVVAQDPAEAGRPNFLIIVADDLGWADVGYHGSPIPTPHIDRLAEQGIELDRHYVAPMCTPTRVALLTGRYWSRFGNISPSNTQVLPFETVTLASVLESRGYDTGITGKWHLGSSPAWGPQRFGFASAYGSLAGGVGPWNHRYETGPYSRTWHRNGELIEEEGHVTDLITEEALKFLRRDRDRPFFLYVPFTAVHNPLDEPAEWLRKGRIADPDRPQYAASTMHLDNSIGRLLQALGETGQQENTLVLFFSDNGGTVDPTERDNRGYPGVYPKGQKLGRNDPLRGRKRELYEGGIRTPAVVSWPGELKPGRLEVPLHVIDWMPTLSKIAGYEPSQDLKWDGEDVRPILMGRRPEPKWRELYWLGVRKSSAALLYGKWKLIVHREDGVERLELFNLEEDDREQQDRSSERATLVAELRARLAAQEALDNDSAPE